MTNCLPPTVSTGAGAAELICIVWTAWLPSSAYSWAWKQTVYYALCSRKALMFLHDVHLTILLRSIMHFKRIYHSHSLDLFLCRSQIRLKLNTWADEPSISCPFQWYFLFIVSVCLSASVLLHIPPHVLVKCYIVYDDDIPIPINFTATVYYAPV